MALLNFNAADVPPSQALDPMPPAWYNAKITAMELKPTKDHAVSGGEYWKTEFTIIDGKYANRKVWTNFNVKNANPEAVRIAYEQISAVCHAVGRMQITQTEELMGLPLQIKVSLRAATAEFDAQNEVKGYKACEGGAGATAAPGSPTAAPKAAPAAVAKPAPAKPAAAPAKPAPVVKHDAMAAALADGWAVHPDDAEYYWKGDDVVPTIEMLALYPAPVAKAAPAKPGAPAKPAPVAEAAVVESAVETVAEGEAEKAPWE